MPSKNGFNKPTTGITRARKAAAAAKKAQNKLHTYQPKPTSADLFKASKIEKRPTITNKRFNLTTETLSNKKLKKIERNLKHLKNNGIESKIMLQLEAKKESEMDIEEEPEKVKTLKDQTTFVREALWAVAEDQSTSGFAIDQSGEGTTLGYAGFY
ncbi:Alb1 protein [Saccharomycopsis crataegensis]|uniref:Alb1 protein n=1 Tax=Saccharomycopsis crataegensis TaxID=43959 RepID=A0AAV5QN97_9ASCO|nr:Alb1 protein [Saccharomycopsis crataegensis]